ncbi:MAG: putative spermidine/putrescine transport system permease protein [Gammaproteobacteria bacterium]|jgi:putative spermidine/putrescine transport system permease protein
MNKNKSSLASLKGSVRATAEPTDKPRKDRFHNFSWVLVLAMPALVFLILPVLPVIPMSFTAGHIIEFPPSEWGLSAYREVISDTEWRDSILLSLKVAALSILFAVTGATFAAIGLSRIKFAGEGIFTALILAPLAMPVVVLALGTFQFFIQVRLNGTILGLAIAHGVLGVPYAFLTVRAALMKLDPSLISAAVSLGAGPVDVLRWVYLPAILPAILSGALLVFVVSFDEVVIALFLAGPNTITFPVKLFTEVQFNLSPGIMAVSTMLLGFVVLFVVVVVTIIGARRVLELKEGK